MYEQVQFHMITIVVDFFCLFEVLKNTNIGHKTLRICSSVPLNKSPILTVNIEIVFSPHSNFLMIVGINHTGKVFETISYWTAWKILVMSLVCLEWNLDLESEELVLMSLEIMGRKLLMQALLCNKDRTLVNGYKRPFGCLVGGDLDGDRPTLFGFLSEKFAPAVSYLKAAWWWV